MNWPQIYLSTKSHRKREEFRYLKYALHEDLDLQLAYNEYISRNKFEFPCVSGYVAKSNACMLVDLACLALANKNAFYFLTFIKF